MQTEQSHSCYACNSKNYYEDQVRAPKNSCIKANRTYKTLKHLRTSTVTMEKTIFVQINQISLWNLTFVVYTPFLIFVAHVLEIRIALELHEHTRTPVTTYHLALAR